MTTFHGGPANGQTLNLARIPHFLRVVQSPDGQWDALDQLADEPRPDEEIHVYVCTNAGLAAMIDGTRYRGPTRIGTTYLHHPNQPDDKTMRHLVDWREWCLANSTPEMRERSPRR